jgi:hypothetical protein
MIADHFGIIDAASASSCDRCGIVFGRLGRIARSVACGSSDAGCVSTMGHLPYIIVAAAIALRLRDFSFIDLGSSPFSKLQKNLTLS